MNDVLQDAISQCEQCVQDHVQYQEQYQAACDWLKLVQDRLQVCSDVSGDKHSIANKLDRVQVHCIYFAIHLILLDSDWNFI